MSSSRISFCLSHESWVRANPPNLRTNTSMLGLLVVLPFLIMLLVFLGEVEAHGLVLVVAQACLLGDVVEDDYWPCHFYFLLILVHS